MFLLNFIFRQLFFVTEKKMFFCFFLFSKCYWSKNMWWYLWIFLSCVKWCLIEKSRYRRKSHWAINFNIFKDFENLVSRKNIASITNFKITFEVYLFFFLFKGNSFQNPCFFIFFSFYFTKGVQTRKLADDWSNIHSNIKLEAIFLRYIWNHPESKVAHPDAEVALNSYSTYVRRTGWMTRQDFLLRGFAGRPSAPR